MGTSRGDDMPARIFFANEKFAVEFTPSTVVIARETPATAEKVAGSELFVPHCYMYSELKTFQTSPRFSKLKYFLG